MLPNLCAWTEMRDVIDEIKNNRPVDKVLGFKEHHSGVDVLSKLKLHVSRHNTTAPRSKEVQ